MLRVARIVPEFCACAGQKKCITLCAQRNNKFFVCAVFCLFNCCRNVVASRTYLAPSHEKRGAAFERNQDLPSRQDAKSAKKTK